MEPNRVLARINGLGRGSVIGFSLIVTDREIIGVDTRSKTFRLWLTMVLGIGLGAAFVFVILDTEFEFGLFGINPLVSFVVNLFLVFAVPIGMLLLIPRILMRRIDRVAETTVRAPKKEIVLIETRKPSTLTGKGYFRVRLLNGTSFNFWTVDKDVFEYLNSIFAKFAPGQIRDRSNMIQESTDIETDRPSNKLVLGILEAVILVTLVGAATVSPGEILAIILGGVFFHALLISGLLLLRRSRRSKRKSR